MGLLSGWFSSSSSSPSAGGGGGSTAGQLAAAEAPKSSGPPAAANKARNVWRSVFDPGSNPNIDRVGSAYYDTVPKTGEATSTWQQIMRAEDYKRRSFSDIDRNRDGFVDAQELKAALPPSVKAADTAALIQQAKPATQGKLTRKEYNDALDKYFLA